MTWTLITQDIGLKKGRSSQHEYQAKMRTQNGKYYYSSYDEIVKNLKET
jgi:hypothetical protein